MFQLFGLKTGTQLWFLHYSEAKKEMRTALSSFGRFYEEFYVEQSWEIYLSKPHKGSV